MTLVSLFVSLLTVPLLLPPDQVFASARVSREQRVIFFAAGGLRQDLVAAYAGMQSLPNFTQLLRFRVKAGGAGLLTQAPTTAGAGWFSLATGAWPGVHGATNDVFAINGAPFGNRAGADAGVPQAETLAQAAERDGKRVAQIEAAVVSAIARPTVDARSFFSGRGLPRIRRAGGRRGRRYQSQAAIRPPCRLRRSGSPRARHPSTRPADKRALLQPGQRDAVATSTSGTGRRSTPTFDSTDDHLVSYDRAVLTAKDGANAAATGASVGDAKSPSSVRHWTARRPACCQGGGSGGGPDGSSVPPS
jgi:hypothetical protein